MGNRSPTETSMTVMKTLLMVFNFGFCVTGIFIFTCGLWMKVELQTLIEEPAGLSSKFPVILMVTGAIFLLCGALACCCTIKDQFCFLYTYGVFLTIIFFVELGAAGSIYAYRNELLEEGFDKAMNQSITYYHLGGGMEISDDLDNLQKMVKCCGSRGSHDYAGAPDHQVPQACCKERVCDTTAENQIYSQGCYTKVVNFFSSNCGLLAGTVMATTIFLLFGVLVSCCLATNIRRTKYELMAQGKPRRYHNPLLRSNWSHPSSKPYLPLSLDRVQTTETKLPA